MLLSRYPKSVQLLAGVVGPSIATGGFLIMALMTFDKAYASVELRLLAFGLYLLLAGIALVLAIGSCRKISKLIS